MRVRAITDYNDLQLDRLVVKGEELDVADARAKVLTEAKVAVIIATPTEKVAETKRATRKKKES